MHCIRALIHGMWIGPFQVIIKGTINASQSINPSFLADLVFELLPSDSFYFCSNNLED